jgi:hypothetical protein
MSICFTTLIRLVKVTWPRTIGQFMLFSLHHADHIDAEPSSAPTMPSRFRLRLLCGAGGYPPNVLQPTGAYCTNPALVPPSSPEALHIRRRERPLIARGGTMGEKCPIKFSLQFATSTVIVGFFNMPQSCDMGQTALLPLRWKAC